MRAWRHPRTSLSRRTTDSAKSRKPWAIVERGGAGLGDEREARNVVGGEVELQIVDEHRPDLEAPLAQSML